MSTANDSKVNRTWHTPTLSMKRNVVHHGRRTISLLAKVASTTEAATKSGSKMGMILLDTPENIPVEM